MTEGASRRRWLLYAAGCLFAYALCLILSAPASVFAWGLARFTYGVILLEGAEGTLWRGRAAQFLVAGAGTASYPVGSLEWDIAALRLMQGQLAVRLTLGGEAAKGYATLVVKPRGLALSQSDFTFPAAAVPAAFPALRFVRPGGGFALRTGDLVLADETVSGQAELEWIDASSPLSPVRPLGTYRTKVIAKEGAAQFELMTLSGALQVSGSGAWSRKTGLTFAGLARARPADSAQLQPLLQLLGRDDGSGSHRLQYVLPP